MDNNTRYLKNSFIYKTVGPCDIKADVYRIDDDRIRPAIIWIHGGALIFGSRTWVKEEQVAFYLQAGFTVISIDYRLAPETKLPHIIEDLQDAYSWVRKKGPALFKINPEQIAIVGHSAGGYLTLMSGICLTPKPNVLVSFYGYGDITDAWYSEPDPFYNQGPSVSKEQAFAAVGDLIISETPSEDSWKNRFNQFYIYCRQQGLWPLKVAGHDPVKNKDWFTSFEPLKNITSEYPPALLLHGMKDTDVPFQQSELMAKALEKNAVPFEFIHNPEWGHVFDGKGLKDPQINRAFEQIRNFLEIYIEK